MKEVKTVSFSFCRILDPSFEDLDDPFKYYSDSGEPIEDRLYLPCGIDPDKKRLGIAFVHPFPQNNAVLEKRKIKNVDFDASGWLIADCRTQRFAYYENTAELISSLCSFSLLSPTGCMG